MKIFYIIYKMLKYLLFLVFIPFIYGQNPTLNPIPTYSIAKYNAQMNAIDDLSRNYTHIITGDSLIERFHTDYVDKYNKYLSRAGVFGAGIAGDRISNLLWRLVDGGTAGTLLDNFRNQSQYCPGIFVYLIGTNDFDSVYNITKDQLVEGIINIEKVVHQQCPATKVLILSLTFRNTTCTYDSNCINTKIRYINRKLAIYYSVSGPSSEFVDVANYGLLDNGMVNSSYFKDYTHFLEPFYELWGKMLFKYFW